MTRGARTVRPRETMTFVMHERRQIADGCAGGRMVPFGVGHHREFGVPAEPSATFVSRLWATFASAWLLVLVITMGVLATHPLTGGRYVATLADLAVLASLYLWLTLRVAPDGDGHLSRSEIGTGHRLAAVIGLALLVAPLVYMVPDGGMWWHVTYAVVAAGLALTPIMALIVIAALVTVAMVTAWFVA